MADRKPSKLQRRKRLDAFLATERAPSPTALWDDVPADDDPLGPWDRAARTALRIEERPMGRHHPLGWTLDDDAIERHRKVDKSYNDVLRRAFAYHKLDPLNPYDWRQLVMRLAMMEFGYPKGLPGRRKTALNEKDKELIQAAQRKLERQLGRKPRDTELARELARKSVRGIESWRKLLATAS